MTRQLLHYEEWMQKIKPKRITVSDIISLNKGTQVKLLMLDRYAKDVVLDKGVNKPHAKHEAADFFQKKCVHYIHDHDLQGHMLVPNENRKRPFEFQIEFAPRSWHQLRDGVFTVNYDLNGEGEAGAAGIPYQLLAPDTKVGWQGPMVLWEDVIRMDKLFYIYY